MKHALKLAFVTAVLLAAIPSRASRAQNTTIFATRGGNPPLYEFSAEVVLSPELHLGYHGEEAWLGRGHLVTIRATDGADFSLRIYAENGDVIQDSGWLVCSGGKYDLTLSAEWDTWTIDVGRTGAFYRVSFAAVPLESPSEPVHWVEAEIRELTMAGYYPPREAGVLLMKYSRADLTLASGRYQLAIRLLESAIGSIQEDIDTGVIWAAKGQKWINVSNYVIQSVAGSSD